MVDWCTHLATTSNYQNTHKNHARTRTRQFTTKVNPINEAKSTAIVLWMSSNIDIHICLFIIPGNWSLYSQCICGRKSFQRFGAIKLLGWKLGHVMRRSIYPQGHSNVTPAHGSMANCHAVLNQQLSLSVRVTNMSPIARTDLLRGPFHCCREE